MSSDTAERQSSSDRNALIAFEATSVAAVCGIDQRQSSTGRRWFERDRQNHVHFNVLDAGFDRSARRSVQNPTCGRTLPRAVARAGKLEACPTQPRGSPRSRGADAQFLDHAVPQGPPSDRSVRCSTVAPSPTRRPASFSAMKWSALSSSPSHSRSFGTPCSSMNTRARITRSRSR